MKNFINTIIRLICQLRRPSGRRNRRLLNERGESLSSIHIREATRDDIPQLARLHVQTWMETYRNTNNPPAYEIRESQWKQQFKIKDGSWFCLVVENDKGELIGFAKGNIGLPDDRGSRGGELNKIYLLRHYQRLGIGRQLLQRVVQRFLENDVSSMVLFGIPQNPSCYFHEAMGGKRLYTKKGEFHGGYEWKDIRQIFAGQEIMAIGAR